MKRIFALLFVLALGAGGFALYRTFVAPPAPPTFASLPPQEQQKRRAEAQKLVSQVEKIAQSARGGKTEKFALRANENQLNTLLQDRLRAQNLPIENPRFRLSNGELALEGQANYNGFKVPVSLAGKPTITNGKLDFAVSSLKLSGLPAPAEWKDKAQTAIGEGLPKALGAATNVQFQTVKITDGEILVSGIVNPNAR